MYAKAFVCVALALPLLMIAQKPGRITFADAKKEIDKKADMINADKTLSQSHAEEATDSSVGFSFEMIIYYSPRDTSIEKVIYRNYAATPFEQTFYYIQGKLVKTTGPEGAFYYTTALVDDKGGLAKGHILDIMNDVQKLKYDFITTLKKASR